MRDRVYTLCEMEERFDVAAINRTPFTRHDRVQLDVTARIIMTIKSIEREKKRVPRVVAAAGWSIESCGGSVSLMRLRIDRHRPVTGTKSQRSERKEERNWDSVETKRPTCETFMIILHALTRVISR